MSRASGDDSSRVRARHKDIPQDHLPLDWPEPVERSPSRRRSPKPLRYVDCPRCLRTKVAVDLNNKIEVIRAHFTRLRAATVQCSASGWPAPPVTDRKDPENVYHWR